MDRFRMLKLFISVSLLGGVCHCIWVSVQERVKAIKGSCVLLPCRTGHYTDVCWYKYQSSGYPVVYCTNDNSEQIAEFRRRTSVPGSGYSGDCSLRIDNVRYGDSEVHMYVWIWQYDGNHQGFYSENERVKINIWEPSAPVMTLTSTPTEGKPFSATCRFRHSCRPSPPQISWQGLNPTSVAVNHIAESDGLTVTEATATFRVTRDNHNTRLSCWSSLSGRTLSSTQLTLSVLYAPNLVNIGYSGNSDVVEGSKTSLRCTSDGRPEPTQYEWIVTQNTTTFRYRGSPVVLQDVRRDTSVSCIATNSVGQGQSTTISLNVLYAPTVVTIDYTGSREVFEGNKISLRCTSDGRPEPTRYEWLVTQNNTTVRLNQRTVVLQDVRRDTSVSCTATNSFGRGQSKTMSLNVHYTPSILPGSFCSIKNGTIQCVCQSEANPTAIISWTIDGSNALYPPFKNITQHNGTMTISELTGPLAYNVTCTATNSVGDDFIQIPVHSEGNTPALLIGAVAGAAGLFIIFVLTVTAIVICKKRPYVESHLSTVQHVKPDKESHDYVVGPDEDIYANTMPGVQSDEDEDRDPGIYANYDNMY